MRRCAVCNHPRLDHELGVARYWDEAADDPRWPHVHTLPLCPGFVEPTPVWLRILYRLTKTKGR